KELGPAGLLPGAARRINRLADMEELVVSERGGRPILLRDLAAIEEGERRAGAARLNGRPAVALGVLKAPGSDAAAVCASVRQKLPGLRATLPEDVELTLPVEGPVRGGASDLLLLDVEFPAAA